MDIRELLATQLLGAKQRMEDTGGASQRLGYYTTMAFGDAGNQRFKHNNLGSITVPAERVYVYVMRLNKVGNKVKAKAYNIGLLFRSVQPYAGKYYLRVNIYKGQPRRLTVEGVSVLVDDNAVYPISNKKLIDELDYLLGDIGNSTEVRTNNTVLSVDNINQI